MNISLSNWWSWGILLLLLMIVAVVDSTKNIHIYTGSGFVCGHHIYDVRK